MAVLPQAALNRITVYELKPDVDHRLVIYAAPLTPRQAYPIAPLPAGDYTLVGVLSDRPAFHLFDRNMPAAESYIADTLKVDAYFAGLLHYMWTLFMFAVEDDTVQQSVDDYARAVPPPPVVPLPALPPLPKLPGCDLAAERAAVAADVAAAIAADAGAPAAPSAEDSELVQSFLNDLYLSAMVFGAEHPEKVAAFTSQAEALRALAEEVATGPRPDDPGPEVCDLAAGEVEPLPFAEPPADAEPYTADLSFLEPPAAAAPEVTGGEGE